MHWIYSNKPQIETLKLFLNIKEYLDIKDSESIYFANPYLVSYNMLEYWDDIILCVTDHQLNNTSQKFIHLDQSLGKSRLLEIPLKKS